MTADSLTVQVLRIAESNGQVRSRDVTVAGIPRATLMRLVRAGRLRQVARGVYELPGRRFSRRHALAEVAARSSRGVFCLLTALHFHRLIARSPDEIWLAIPNKARAPEGEDPPLRVVRFSGAALAEGIEQHMLDGVAIRVYSAGKTVADCFKFRDRVGTDTAVAALHAGLRRELTTIEELRHYAAVCRVREAMLPILDAAAGVSSRAPA